jgi:predicted membrane metal-binding protein
MGTMRRSNKWIAAAICVGITFAVVTTHAQKPVRKPAAITLSMTGDSTFKGQLKGTCEFDPADNRVSIDGVDPAIAVHAFVDYPSNTPFKVAIEGIGGGKGKTVARVTTVVNNYNYVATSGAGALDDAAGASGHLKADGFIKAGVSMQPQKLTADLAWKCQ